MRRAVPSTTSSASCPNHGEGLILAVFDIGQMSTSLTVVLNGQTIFEREQAFGGNQLTQDIVRLYGLTPEEAELKKRTGDLPDNYEKELLKPFVEQGATDISRVAAVLLHVDALHPGRPDLPGRRRGGHARAGRGGGQKRPRCRPRCSSPFQGMEISERRAREATAPRCTGDAGQLRAGDAEVRRMIRINLLPHREMRRERRKKDFIGTARRHRHCRRRAGLRRRLRHQPADRLAERPQ